MSYKELDGAVPGSKDILDFDYISDQPSIAGDTWENSGSLAASGEEGRDASGTATAESNGYGSNGDFDDVSRARQQEVARAVGTSYYEHPDSSSPTEVPNRHTSIGEEAAETGGGSEMAEYLKSQQMFSYDSPLTSAGGEASTAQIVDKGLYTVGHDSNRTADETNISVINNTGNSTKAKAGSTGEGNQAQLIAENDGAWI